MTERQVKLLRVEADVYRKALIRLWADATSGARKTMDKGTVGDIAGNAIDQGNELFRRAKEAG